jgi:hypothetical protein
MRTNYTPEEVERFWSYVDTSGGDDACWLWLRKTDKDGYGHFTPSAVDRLYGLPRWPAHRFAHFITSGVYPDRLLVCHSCDNPPCCNPAHLFIGTNQDNVDDMMSKGRKSTGAAWNPIGETNPKAKLTDADVIAMRRRWNDGGVSKSQLGREYGVSSTMASWVILGRFWKHLPSVDELRDAS